jgi:putative tryptophan/tyrosine transport system substrate-binding protein
MMHRLIGFLVILTLSFLVVPLAGEAQPSAKVPRLGFLRPSLASPCRVDSFAQGLRRLGYVEGHNLVIEWRCADGTVERQRALAVELVQLAVDVFVAASPDGPLAAMQATRTIPIVFVTVPDPVAMGLVANLAQPGGNVTGVTNQVGLEFHAKRLQLLLEAVPSVTRVAALQQGAFARALPARAHIQQAAEEAARRLGVHLQLVEVGGLMSYNVSYAALFRRAASYVDRLLKGAKPADLPVEQPTTFELVLNLKTAEALGLTIPPTLLFQADEVIR